MYRIALQSMMGFHPSIIDLPSALQSIKGLHSSFVVRDFLLPQIESISWSCHVWLCFLKDQTIGTKNIITIASAEPMAKLNHNGSWEISIQCKIRSAPVNRAIKIAAASSQVLNWILLPQPGQTNFPQLSQPEMIETRPMLFPQSGHFPNFLAPL